MGCLCGKPEDIQQDEKTEAITASGPTKDMPYMKKRSSRCLDGTGDDGGGVFQNRRRKETTFPPTMDNRGTKSLIPAGRSMSRGSASQLKIAVASEAKEEVVRVVHSKNDKGHKVSGCLNMNSIEERDRLYGRRMIKLLKQRQGTAQIRENWKSSCASRNITPYTPLTINSDVCRQLRNRDMRDYQNHLLRQSEDLQEHKVSERGDHFLRRRKERDNLSTPKYFTKINTRQKVQMRNSTSQENFRTLTSRRLTIPNYQVPTNLPELSSVSPLVTISTDVSKPSSQQSTRRSNRGDINDWINLVTRPVTDRPSYAAPIKCKTPDLSITLPDYHKPKKTVFKLVDKRVTPREFVIDPEFCSEVLKLQHIQGLASNPLKYGWGA